ncbi:hypothetical protein Dimus_004980 [Dionaea muscipula]
MAQEVGGDIGEGFVGDDFNDGVGGSLAAISAAISGLALGQEGDGRPSAIGWLVGCDLFGPSGCDPFGPLVSFVFLCFLLWLVLLLLAVVGPYQRDVVYGHLIVNGFVAGYKEWIHHGEDFSNGINFNDGDEEPDSNAHDNMDGLVHDTFRDIFNDYDNVENV